MDENIEIIMTAPIDMVEPRTKKAGISSLFCICGGGSILTFSHSIILAILGALEK